MGLTRLDLLDTAVDVDDLAHLHNLPQLKELHTDGIMPASELGKLGALPLTSVGISVEHNTVADACSWLQTASGRLQKLALFGHVRLPILPMLPILPILELPKLGKLKVLKACSIRLSIVHVAALTQLTELQLKSCGLDDAAVCSLSSLSNLRVLKFLFNPQITGAQGSMEGLARSMPQLTLLALGGWAGGCWASAEVAAELAFGKRLIGSHRKGDSKCLELSLLPLLGESFEALKASVASGLGSMLQVFIVAY